MRSASSCGRFSTAQGVDLAFVKDTADIHTGTAIITIADADNTIVVVPGANALVSAEDVAAPVLAKGDVAVSQFEIPQAHDRRLLQTGARGRRDHDPQSGAGDGLRP